MKVVGERMQGSLYLIQALESWNIPSWRGHKDGAVGCLFLGFESEKFAGRALVLLGEMGARRGPAIHVQVVVFTGLCSY